MKRCFIAFLFLLFFLLFHSQLEAQFPSSDDAIAFVSNSAFDESGNPDKCGFDPALASSLLQSLGDHWGYGYDDLLADLPVWATNPYVRVDSIGASVQHRAIWELTITSNTNPLQPRHTVYIHARTHPGEVQSWWVTKEIINLLLSEDEWARQVRETCVFYIIPMYNPDGVELEYPRENANGVDIESNWNKTPLQPEVAVLRNRFQQLMDSAAPIKVALNMHSAYGTNRYFVYHDAAGTSLEYAGLEKQFIEGVRTFFPGGIQPWNYFISWKSGTATQYPESWFWLNFREKVMALTYEDMNNPAAGEYNRTAFALVSGILDYLNGIDTVIPGDQVSIPSVFTLKQNYPNPFNSRTIIKWHQPMTGSAVIYISDALGRQVTTLIHSDAFAGSHVMTINMDRFPAGIYFYRLAVNGMSTPVRRMILLK